MYAGKERAYRVGLHQQDDEPLGHLLIIPEVVLLANVEEGLFQQAADILTFHMCYTFRSHVEASAQRGLQNNLSRYLDKGTSLEEFLEQAEAGGLSIFPGAYQCVISKNKPEKRVEEQPQVKLKNLKQYIRITSEIKQSDRASFCVQGYDVLDLFNESSRWFSRGRAISASDQVRKRFGCIEEAGDMAFYKAP